MGVPGTSRCVSGADTVMITDPFLQTLSEGDRVQGIVRDRAIIGCGYRHRARGSCAGMFLRILTVVRGEEGVAWVRREDL